MEHRTPVTRFLMPAAVVVFCGFVFWLVIPIFWNSLIAQKSNDTIIALKHGPVVSEARLRATLQAIGPVDLSRPAIGDRLVNQGIMTLTLALRLGGNDAERVEFLQQAKDLAQARLREAPADTHTWARLAFAEYYLNGPSEVMLNALRMSHLTGPFEYFVLWPRLKLGVLLWGLLDEGLQQMTITQAEMIWREGGRIVLARYVGEMPEAPQARIREHLLSMADGEAVRALLEPQ